MVSTRLTSKLTKENAMPAEMPAANQPTSQPAKNDLPTSPAVRTWNTGTFGGLLFGIAGGLLAWVAIEAFVPMIKPPDDEVSDLMAIPDSMIQEYNMKRAIFALGVIGGFAGLGLAVGEGVFRRCWKTTIAGGIACGVLGAAFGALAGYVGHIEYVRLKVVPDMTDLQRTLAVHGTMFAIIGAGVGLVLGALLVRRGGMAIKCLFAGLLSAVLAVVLFTILAATLMPNTITDVVIPAKAAERVLWICLTVGLMGLMIAAIAHPPAPKTA